MTATKGIRSIIDDAKSNGLRVEESETSCLISTGKTNKSIGVVIYGDGTACRSDVPLDNCALIRRQKQIRSILGL